MDPIILDQVAEWIEDMKSKTNADFEGLLKQLNPGNGPINNEHTSVATPLYTQSQPQTNTDSERTNHSKRIKAEQAVPYLF